MIRAITVCVDYHDILNLTLPYNRSFYEDIMVVTSSADKRTIDVAQQHGAQVHITEAFYGRKAVFNKFAAIEEALDVMGRRGWILLLDADVVIPKQRQPINLVPGKLYTPHRRIVPTIPTEIPIEKRWRRFKRTMVNEEFAGYFQLFHADDPVLGASPWHDINFTWAGSADSFFNARWKESSKVRPPFEVLHLGPPFVNWAGRVTPYIDGSLPEDIAKKTEIRDVLKRARRFQPADDKFKMEKIE